MDIPTNNGLIPSLNARKFFTWTKVVISSGLNWKGFYKSQFTFTSLHLPLNLLSSHTIKEILNVDHDHDPFMHTLHLYRSSCFGVDAMHLITNERLTLRGRSYHFDSDRTLSEVVEYL